MSLKATGHPKAPSDLTGKTKSFIGKNKQLLTGLVIGALIMLPTGLYLSERNNNQRVDTPITTQAQPIDATPKETTPKPAEPIVEQAKPTPTAPQQQAPKPFVASVCTKEFLPRPPTITVVKDYMYVDSPPYYQSGMDGWRQTCTTNSNGVTPEDVVLEPIADEIWVGVKERE